LEERRRAAVTGIAIVRSGDVLANAQIQAMKGFAANLAAML